MSEIAETQTEFAHPLGWRMVLAKSANDLTLGDIEDWLLAYQGVEVAKTLLADHHKVLLASIETGWLVEPVLKAEQVRSFKPARQARWMADQINQVYLLATVVPAK